MFISYLWLLEESVIFACYFVVRILLIYIYIYIYRERERDTHTHTYTDGDTDYFDFVAGVLQGDTLAPYLFIICLDYVLRTSIDKIKENGFKLTKEGNRRYPAKTISDADYAIDIARLQMHPPTPKPYYIVWNELLQAMLTRKNICALIKQATSPH